MQFKNTGISLKIIHSCTCIKHSFSRKVMWLELASTNRDPGVILSYFLRCMHGVKCESLYAVYMCIFGVYITINDQSIL